MRTRYLLGAAALATLAWATAPAPSAHAGEVKMGGYYMFRVLTADATPFADAANVDDDNFWSHELQMNMDFIATPKSHAHMVFRPIEDNTVALNNGTVGGEWNVRQAWLETEMWTVGVKVGEMPISLHDDILVNHDTTGFGSIMLSKSFGNLTGVLAQVKLVEGNRGSQDAGTTFQDEDDLDLYVASLLGKSAKACSNGCINYQLSAAYLDAGRGQDTDGDGLYADDNFFGLGQNEGQRTNNLWLAATVGTNWNGVELTATAIYESGFDNMNRATVTGYQQSEDDFLVALRAEGPLKWGAWNAYAVYAGENFDNIVDGEAGWSDTWGNAGPGAADPLDNWAANALGAGNANANATMTENMMAVGVGVTFNAMGWEINPRLDYASLVETNFLGANRATSESAWGGSLGMTKEIDDGLTLALTGIVVDPDDDSAALNYDTMHYLSADLTMVF